jgi:hypothetical protein
MQSKKKMHIYTYVIRIFQIQSRTRDKIIKSVEFWYRNQKNVVFSIDIKLSREKNNKMTHDLIFLHHLCFVSRVCLCIESDNNLDLTVRLSWLLDKLKTPCSSSKDQILQYIDRVIITVNLCPLTLWVNGTIVWRGDKHAVYFVFAFIYTIIKWYLQI